MPSLIKIPYSTVEYQARFAGPVVKLIAGQAEVIQAVVDALLPFGFQFMNMETQGTLANYNTILRLPGRNIVFQYGADGCTFTKDSSSWQTTEEDLRVLIAARSAVLAQGAEVGAQTVTLAMHLQLLETPREDILTRFTPPPLRAELSSEYKPIEFAGAAKFSHGSLLFDYSATVANGIFVRFISRFDGKASLEDIVVRVRKDEAFVFTLLDVQEGEQ